MKKAELNCMSSAACRPSTASSLIHGGDNKTVGMLMLITRVGLLFSTQKTDQESIKKLDQQAELIMALVSVKSYQCPQAECARSLTAPE